MKFLTTEKYPCIPSNVVIITIGDAPWYAGWALFYMGKWFGDWITIAEPRVNEMIEREVVELLSKQAEHTLQRLREGKYDEISNTQEG